MAVFGVVLDGAEPSQNIKKNMTAQPASRALVIPHRHPCGGHPSLLHGQYVPGKQAPSSGSRRPARREPPMLPRHRRCVAAGRGQARAKATAEGGKPRVGHGSVQHSLFPWLFRDRTSWVRTSEFQPAVVTAVYRLEHTAHFFLRSSPLFVWFH